MLGASTKREKRAVGTCANPPFTRRQPRRRAPRLCPEGHDHGGSARKGLPQRIGRDARRVQGKDKFQEWFKTTQSSFENIKLAMQSVGHGIYYDFTKFSATAMPEEFIGKGRKLEGGLTLATTDHGLRGSSRLSANEIRRTLQVGDEVTEEDGTTIRLTSDDIEDVRTSTPRGLKILQLITDRGPATTDTTQTTAPQTTTTGTTTTGPAAPTTTAAPRTRARATPTPTLRMTRSQVAALRNAQTAEEEKKRRRIARALAQLTI